MPVNKYVVIGASAAGINAARQLRLLDDDARITVISKDEYVYSRCILHYYMEGLRDLKGLEFMEDEFWQTYRIRWLHGKTVTGLNVEEKKVILDGGREVEYDKLLIATGSHTFFPPIPNLKEAKNSIGFRNLDDCEFIMKEAKKESCKHIIVMGAGLVGIDVVTGLLEYDKDISLVEFQDRMLSIQLDKRAASTYEKAFDAHGVKQYYSKGVKDLIMDDDGYIKEIMLTSGEFIPCDLLICCAGVRANVEFLQDTPVECDKFGLIIDERGRTNIKDIYGAGDVTGRGPIWSVATKEGLIAADNMVGLDTEIKDFFTSKSTMNFLGIPTMSLGINTPPDETYEVESIEDAAGNYKKVIHKDGKIYGAILQGNISFGGVLTQLIAREIDIRKVKKPLFDIDYSDFFNQDEKYRYYYEGQK